MELQCNTCAQRIKHSALCASVQTCAFSDFCHDKKKMRSDPMISDSYFVEVGDNKRLYAVRVSITRQRNVLLWLVSGLFEQLPFRAVFSTNLFEHKICLFEQLKMLEKTAIIFQNFITVKP